VGERGEGRGAKGTRGEGEAERNGAKREGGKGRSRESFYCTCHTKVLRGPNIRIIPHAHAHERESSRQRE
jgi:hypothetical protein